MARIHHSFRYAVATGFLFFFVVGGTALAAGTHRTLWMSGRKVALSATTRAPIPSFSRQTKLACNVCHTAFPQLTSFGRLFKLNGYTMTGIEKVEAGAGAAGLGLSLALIPPVSVMALTSLTHTKTTPQGTQNSTVEFPDQLSLFVGEAITPRMGTFLQFTYAAADGSFGWDNADIRYANHTSIAEKPIIFGVTLNNSPTVQDVWNSTPVWGFPFVGSEIAASPAAAPAIAGDLAQRVAGLGAYAFWNNLLYAEFSAYRSAPQGGAHPADSTAEGTIKGVSPYWRVALSHEAGNQSIEVGTFGMSTREFPEGVTGLTNQFKDVGFDAQYQRALGRNNLTAHGSYIHEKQTLAAALQAGEAANGENVLKTWKVDGQLVFAKGFATSVGYFSTTGSADDIVFEGGRPDSRGLIGELDINPWLNTRFGAQYVLYNKFNNGSGHAASDNNTLYLFAWLVF